MEKNILSKSLDASGDRVDCELCNVKGLHKNDYQKHCDGKRHRYRIREQSRKNNGTVPKYEHLGLECVHCATKFTAIEFYRIHMGSKKHKRKLKKLGITGPRQKDLSTKITTFAAPFLRATVFKPDFPKEDQFREKYKKRNIRSEDQNFQNFIYSLTAYLLLRLALDEDVEDFKVSVNDKKWKSFGDIVIKVVYKTKKTRYVIQCKQVTNNIKILDSPKEVKFNMEKQILKLNEIKAKEGKAKFLIFTTCGITSKFKSSLWLNQSTLSHFKVNTTPVDSTGFQVQLKQKSNKHKDLINTTDDNGNVYLLSLDKNNTNYKLPTIYLYTNQTKIKHYGRLIDGLIFSKFEKAPEVHRTFIKYIENWGEGKAGGNYKLRKNDVILKIGEILLMSHTMEPEILHPVANDNFELWNKVTNIVDITMIQQKPGILKKICEPLNTIVEDGFSTKIDSITRSIRVETLSSLNPKLKAYLFDEVSSNVKEDINLKTVYRIFWKSGLIPLILQAENQNEETFVLQVVELMNTLSSSLNVKFILLVPLLPNSGALVKLYPSLKFFVCLEDIKTHFTQIFLQVLAKTQIKVTESYDVSLSTIFKTDQFFFKTVSADIFLYITLGKYRFKPLNLSKNTVDDMKLILDDDDIEELKKQINALNSLTEAVLEFNNSENNNWVRNINPRLFDY